MSGKEITNAKDKLSTFPRENQKDALEYLRNLHDHTHGRLKGVKWKTPLRREGGGTGLTQE